jgi:hypothetical protein
MPEIDEMKYRYHQIKCEKFQHGEPATAVLTRATRRANHAAEMMNALTHFERSQSRTDGGDQAWHYGTSNPVLSITELSRKSMKLVLCIIDNIAAKEN